MNTISIEVEDGSHFDPWTPQPIDLTHYRRVKTYTRIGDDPTMYRVRARDGNKLTLCLPEDDDEPEEPR